MDFGSTRRGVGVKIPYDPIVLGLAKSGLTMARIVRGAGWSVLVIGLQLLDSLAQASGFDSEFETKLQAEGVHFGRGSPQFVDRRILEVSGVRYEARHIFIASGSVQDLGLACVEIEIVAGHVELNAQQSNLCNLNVTFSEVMKLTTMGTNNALSNALAGAEGLRMAHQLLGISKPQAGTTTTS